VNRAADGGPRWLTISEAAVACGLSRDTVRRRIRSGALPGARRDPSGSSPWLVPIRDLLAAGLDRLGNLRADASPNRAQDRVRNALRSADGGRTRDFSPPVPWPSPRRPRPAAAVTRPVLRADYDAVDGYRLPTVEITDIVNQTVAELLNHRELFFDSPGDPLSARETISTRDIGQAAMTALGRKPRDRATRLRYALLFGPTDGAFTDAESFARWLEPDLAPTAERGISQQPKHVAKRRKNNDEHTVVPFETEKLYNSIKFAVKKRPVGERRDENLNKKLIDRICFLVLEAVSGQRTVSSGQLATETMRVLLSSDDPQLARLIEPGARQLAYLRVASSSKQFARPQDFYNEAQYAVLHQNRLNRAGRDRRH
jgi:excisionase family DNA binding protein